uniref:N-acetyltransferase domain-containing protein n=1 Tax=Tetradesmus obliquus TaxID=3088 RepID=A0A383VEC0_TETOB|eukprot:jgi/Sobl393_1/5628/SZX63082.1
MPCPAKQAAARRVAHHRHYAPHAAAPWKNVLNSSRCRSAASGPPALLMPAGIRRLAPNSDMDATEQAVRALGEAFVMNSLHRVLQTRLGKEQNVFAGLSRMMLDSFEDQPVLLVTECGSGAAVLLRSCQFASLAADVRATPTPFSLTPGSLQMLTAIPQDSLPTMMQRVQQAYEAGLSAVQQPSSISSSSSSGSSSSSSAGHAGEYLQVAIIGVTPAAQGRGLGLSLLQAAVAAAQQDGLPLAVQAAGEGVADFFAKAGMQQVGRHGLHPVMRWEAR